MDRIQSSPVEKQEEEEGDRDLAELAEDWSGFVASVSANLSACLELENWTSASASSASSSCNFSGSTVQVDDDEDAMAAGGGGGGAGEVETFFRIIRVVVPVIFGLIGLLGLAGNLLVIVIVISNKQMRNTTNILIINLALADLAFIVICVPFTAASYVLDVWPFGLWWCKISQYAIHVTAHESVYTLVLMSFDRYLAVVHPISSLTLRTERNALAAIGASWLVVCAANAPMLAVFEIFRHRDDVSGHEASTCLNVRLVTDQDYGKLFYGTFFFFAFLLPLTLVLLLYGFLIRRLLFDDRSRKMASSDGLRAKRRVTRMVIVVVVTFAVCWIPLHVLFLAQFFAPSSNEFSKSSSFLALKIVACCLAYMNSCVNPILYAFLSEVFRQNFSRFFLQCVRGCRRRSANLPSSSSHSHQIVVGVKGGANEMTTFRVVSNSN